MPLYMRLPRRSRLLIQNLHYLRSLSLGKPANRQTAPNLLNALPLRFFSHRRGSRIWDTSSIGWGIQMTATHPAQTIFDAGAVAA